MILIRIDSIEGSAPREAGAWMTVSAEETRGSIGGGALEHVAQGVARNMLASGEARRDLTLALGPEADQCCGGRVRLSLSKVEAAPPAPPKRPVYLYGAGHVGQAVKAALTPLPFAPVSVDSRPETAPDHLTPLPEAVAEAAPAGAVHLVFTHSHALDLEIVAALLGKGGFAWLGLIGSKTKKARFDARLRARGLDPAPIVCPIGLPEIRGKAPAVIAASVAAQLLRESQAWTAFISCADR